MFDVIIVGAGPAGLSAALMLGRCRRRVPVVDHGRNRNAASHALHGFLTRDGIPPAEFLRLSRAELTEYDCVQLREGEVVDAVCAKDARFDVRLATGEQFRSRKLLIATGVVDNLPEIDGFREMYGQSVFHCPYCDGWAVRDPPLAIYGHGARGSCISLVVTQWSLDLVLCTDGPSGIDDEAIDTLRQNGIQVTEERVRRLEGESGRLTHVVFANGDRLPRRALFFSTGQYQRSDLLARLGCEFNEKGTVRTGKYETTHLPGLFVAGDASRAVQWVVVAASEGAEAAFAINTDLLKEDLK